MDIMEAIRGRRTVRAFKNVPLPDDLFGNILEAATWAPSHKNEQPWSFAAVGPETRAKLLAMFTKMADELLASGEVPPPAVKNFESLKNDFGQAPRLLAVYAAHGENDVHTQENLAATACAVQNLLLAAWEQGVGAVWLTVGSVPPARAVLQAGDNRTVVALLALGYLEAVPPALPREPWNHKLQQLP